MYESPPPPNGSEHTYKCEGGKKQGKLWGTPRDFAYHKSKKKLNRTETRAASTGLKLQKL